jgi:photosystem II stability/assembly factor-like uncharacterized protein
LVAEPNPLGSITAMAIDPSDSRMIYAAGVHLSENGGKTWRQVLEKDRHIYDVTIDPRNSKILYASGFESSAWRSSDRGEHWSPIPGFNFKWGHRVMTDPADAQKIYITTFAVVSGMVQ